GRVRVRRRRPVRRLGRPHRPGWRRLAHAPSQHRVAAPRAPARHGGGLGPRPRHDARAGAAHKPVPRGVASMSERFQAPRGTRDWVGEDAAVRRQAIDLARAVFEPAGYEEVVTPGFEDTALFARTSGESSDVVQKEMY